MRLENKVITITGGTSGIGLELVSLLSPRNTVLVIARESERLRALRSRFPSVILYPADLSDTGEVEQTGNQIQTDYRHIDLLINNAAMQYAPQFTDDNFDFNTIAKEININLYAVCALSCLLLPSLTHDSEAAIVNINSALGLYPKTGSAVYCATKGGVNIFTRSLRYQLENTSIKVMQAFMPLVDTPMTDGRGTGKMTAKKAAQEIIRGIEKGVEENYIGKTKLLKIIGRLSPSLAERILKRG